MTTVKHIVLLAVILACQHKSFGQTNLSDTTFILRDTSGGIYRAVFIEPDKNSRYYDRLTDFRFDHGDSSTYQASIKAILKNNTSPFIKAEISTNLPRQWCGLNSYKGKAYLYAASNWTGFRDLMLTDTTIVRYSGEGPVASKIHTFKEINENTFEFLLLTFRGTTKKITVHIIDWGNQIAVFDNHDKSEDFRYSLKVGASKARQFPIVVNYCEEVRQVEFNFDTFDFRKLLAQKP